MTLATSTWLFLSTLIIRVATQSISKVVMFKMERSLVKKLAQLDGAFDFDDEDYKEEDYFVDEKDKAQRLSVRNTVRERVIFIRDSVRKSVRDQENVMNSKGQSTTTPEDKKPQKKLDNKTSKPSESDTNSKRSENSVYVKRNSGGSIDLDLTSDDILAINNSANYASKKDSVLKDVHNPFDDESANPRIETTPFQPRGQRLTTNFESAKIIPPALLKTVLDKTVAGHSGVGTKYNISNFYMTDSISRASSTMAICTKEILNKVA